VNDSVSFGRIDTSIRVPDRVSGYNGKNPTADVVDKWEP